MEQLSENYEDAETASIRTVAVIAEVDCGERTELSWAVSDDRLWFQVAFLNEAKIAAEDRIEAARSEE
jgi:hypothetical protein